MGYDTYMSYWDEMLKTVAELESRPKLTYHCSAETIAALASQTARAAGIELLCGVDVYLDESVPRGVIQERSELGLNMNRYSVHMEAIDVSLL